MEAQDQVVIDLQQNDIGHQAINGLQIQNQVFEGRFNVIGDALTRLTNGMIELQTSVS